MRIGVFKVMLTCFLVRTVLSHLDSFRDNFHFANQGRSVCKWVCIFSLASDTYGELAYTNASSAKRARFVRGFLGKSAVYRLYRIGERTDPCGTPACVKRLSDRLPSTLT